jgi:hypothetical protein
LRQSEEEAIKEKIEIKKRSLTNIISEIKNDANDFVSFFFSFYYYVFEKKK